MPQYRKLHVKSVDSQDINDMPDDFTRLLWILMPLGLDSEGRGIYNPGWVKAKIFPLRDDVTIEQVQIALEWFAERGMIVKYEVLSRFYFHIPTWHTYQGNTDKEAKSVIPAPTLQSAKRTRKARATQELVQSKSVSDADADADADAQVDADASGAIAPVPDHPQRKRDLLFDAICEVCVIDPKVKGNGATVGKIKSALLESEPPYTPDEVRKFGAWWNSDAWRCGKGPPTIWKLKEQIGIVRNGHSENGNIPDKFAQAERLTRERLAANGIH
jgi:hypothetical protein